MIVYESGPAVVRAGELEIAGRRVAARLAPYAGHAWPGPLRFDPIGRRAILAVRSGRVAAGPAEAEAWRRALERAPAGPALVGPGFPAEEVRGAFRAAAEGAREAGRAVYLLDPDPAGLPEGSVSPFVALFCGLADGETLSRLSAAAERSIPSGLLLPIVPAWTAEEEFLSDALGRAAAAGARFAAGIPMAGDGESRRRFVQARSLLEPGSEEAFFGRVHHGDWAGQTERGLRRLAERAAGLRLADLPPRPVGAGEPRGNAAAAARLEELAARHAGDEHRFSLLCAAARWIDEWGRDLAPVAREGNFRRVFPFPGEAARVAEEALAGGPP